MIIMNDSEDDHDDCYDGDIDCVIMVMKIILSVQLLSELMRGTIVTKEKCICCRGVEGVLANTQSVFFYHKHNTVFLDKPFPNNNTGSKWPFCQNANVLEAQLRTKLADNTKLFCFLEHLTD